MNATMLFRAGLLLCALAALAGGQAVVAEYTATQIDLGLIEPGTVACPGGQPTGLWPFGPPCSPGSRVHVRGAVFQYLVSSSEPRVSGDLFVVVNGNFDGWTVFGPGSGPMWGTARREVAGGVWEGPWTGKRTVTADNFVVAIRAEAHGSGSVEGLKLDEQSGFSLLAPPYVRGRILQPGGK